MNVRTTAKPKESSSDRKKGSGLPTRSDFLSDPLVQGKSDSGLGDPLDRILPSGTQGLEVHPSNDTWEKEAHDFKGSVDNVPVKDDADSHAINNMIGSTAVTIGGTVHWGDSAPSLGSTAGQDMFRHESAHVGQQRGLSGFTPVGSGSGLMPAQAMFGYTRSGLSGRGVSVVFKGGNNAKARMLKMIDAYWAKHDVQSEYVALIGVVKEAKHFKVKHPTSRQKGIFDEIIQDAEAEQGRLQRRYLEAMERDDLLADSGYVESSGELFKEPEESSSEPVGMGMLLGLGRGVKPKKSQAQKLIEQHGLTQAEVAALKVYCGPAYKFINPALDGNTAKVGKRLPQFVEETKDSYSENTSINVKAAKSAQKKLDGSEDPVARAMAEALMHADIATKGLQKLPPYTGWVYAGGGMLLNDLRTKFQIGNVESRGAFASTSYDESQAASFSMNGWGAWRKDQTKDNPSAAYMLRYKSKSGRKVEDLSPRPSEKEILFAPNSKLKFVSWEKMSGIWDVGYYINCEEIV